MNHTYTFSRHTRRQHARAQDQSRRGQFHATQKTLESLLRDSPRNLAARFELADVLARNDDWKHSSAPLLEAIQYGPYDADSMVQLAQGLLMHCEVAAAGRYLDAAMRARDATKTALRSAASLYAMMGKASSARDALERALKAGIDDRLSHHIHGLFLKFCGDLDGARHAFHLCVRRWPDDAESTTELARLEKGSAQAELLAHTERQLHGLPTGTRSRNEQYRRACFEYARFRILDDLDRGAEAWNALTRSNRVMQELIPYHGAQLKGTVDALVRNPLPDNTYESKTAQSHEAEPVFIVGMPRSGTTLLEQMLCAHSNVVSAGEIPTFERQLRVLTNVAPGSPGGLVRVVERSRDIDFRELGERYLHQTRWRAGQAPWYIDKLPQNIRMVGLIRRALPHARIIHIVRSPMDVCFSNLTSWFGKGAGYSFSIPSVVEYYRQYARLAAHWRKRLPGAMLELDYEDLVHDPESGMHKVLAWLGLEPEAACLHPETNREPVQSPSSVQVREAIHKRSIGRWRRYESELAGLQEALDDVQRVDD